MSPVTLLWLFLMAIPSANSDVQCEGLNCPPRPTPVTLLPATTVSPKRPVTLLPASTPATRHTTPANHTTAAPANHTTAAPANHTTAAPANHTTAAPANHTTAAPANHTTAAPANHTTAAPANHTTAAPANHTTAAPANHTTAAPANHTTAAPANHTTAAPANHTTAAPANHTTAAPANHTTHSVLTTTMHPTSPPELQKGNYKVTNNKTVCAMAALKLQLRVQYKTKKKETAWGVFFIQPNKTKTSGSCGTYFVNMTLTFPEGFLTFGFKMNSKQQTFYLNEIRSELMYQFPGTTASQYSARNSSMVMLQTHLGHSFLCSNQSVKAESTFWVDLVDEQIQAFNISRNQQFGSAEVCPEDKRLPIVAIVVAVVLVLLIVIVLLAYLIGRRRNPAGYESI
ncbi:macrosialin-like isoform X2 [Heterodontus francisci]|uniref:macrosialin-like isoform X2 n=1 Tax=Heterodontus francisci TaxID=7792 RepID=UPI00355B4169